MGSTKLMRFGLIVFAALLVLLGCTGNSQKIDCSAKVGELKDGCLYDKAVAELNPDYCGQMEPPLFNPDFSIAQAMDNCYKEVAVAKADSDVCLQVKDKAAQAACLTEYAATTGEQDPCQILQEPEKTSCARAGAMREAVLKKDFAYCDSLKSDDEIFAECYSKVAACLKGNCQ